MESDGVRYLLSSETQGQSFGSGEKAGRKFSLRAKEPLGTDSHRTISKNSSGAGSWLGTKNALYYCAQSANTSQWVVFVCSYMKAIFSITACLVYAPKKCTQSGNFRFDIKSPSDPARLLCQMQMNSSEPYQSSWREWILLLLVYSFAKREVRHFHG